MSINSSCCFRQNLRVRHKFCKTADNQEIKLQIQPPGKWEWPNTFQTEVHCSSFKHHWHYTVHTNIFRMVIQCLPNKCNIKNATEHLNMSPSNTACRISDGISIPTQHYPNSDKHNTQ